MGGEALLVVLGAWLAFLDIETCLGLSPCCLLLPETVAGRYGQSRVLIVGEGSRRSHITKTGTWKRNQDRNLVIHKAVSKLSSQFPEWARSSVTTWGLN